MEWKNVPQGFSFSFFFLTWAASRGLAAVLTLADIPLMFIDGVAVLPAIVALRFLM